jgi:hypothetical protein
MRQQTAVEYLLQKLYTEYRFAFSGTIVDKAKEMEKEQIIDAFDIGNTDENIIGKEYYNKTYNK